MTRRIWELDALRGLCILGMLGVHLCYNLGVDLGPLQQWGGAAFLLISGCSVTLGTRHLRRGLTVFACGMLCTAVTWAMARLGLMAPGTVIHFGVLHCLGLCMLLWSVFSRLPRWSPVLLGPGFIALGLWLDTLRVSFPWLTFLGLRQPDYVAGDYFPLVLNLGFFLTGSFLGRLLYRQKQTLLPRISPPRFLCLCGRHSLWIYLLHQPALLALTWALRRIFPQ